MFNEFLKQIPASAKSAAILPELQVATRAVSVAAKMLGASSPEQYGPTYRKLADDVESELEAQGHGDDPFGKVQVDVLRAVADMLEALDRGADAVVAEAAGDIDEGLRSLLGD